MMEGLPLITRFKWNNLSKFKSPYVAKISIIVKSRNGTLFNYIDGYSFVGGEKIY